VLGREENLDFVLNAFDDTDDNAVAVNRYVGIARIERNENFW
jgi:hypothetical protein